MTMHKNSKKQQLERAILSNSLDELRNLHTSQYMNVRRAVAKNKHIDSEIANILALDPVLNVSYMASLNPNCNIQRNFFENGNLHVCVVCEEDERDLPCKDCAKL